LVDGNDNTSIGPNEVQEETRFCKEKQS